MSWSYVFYLTSAIYLFGGIIFVMFISAKPESWGRKTIDSKIVKCNLENNIVENDNTISKSC